MRKLLLFTSILILGSASSALAQSECTTDESISAEQATTITDARCCEKNSARRRNRCLRNAKRKIHGTRRVITPEVSTASREAIQSLRDNSCNLDAATVPACTDDTSTTTAEAIANVEAAACDLQYRDARKARLKKLSRKLRAARRFMGTTYVGTIRSQIRSLLTDPDCGAGGEVRSVGSCSRVVNPRDGADGNVYKMADHTNNHPVFVTHNGAGSGSALTNNGTLIERMRYTGLGNRDARGLRHHYRLGRNCTSYPTNFLLKIGSTCYEINNRCGRID